MYTSIYLRVVHKQLVTNSAKISHRLGRRVFDGCGRRSSRKGGRGKSRRSRQHHPAASSTTLHNPHQTVDMGLRIEEADAALGEWTTADIFRVHVLGFIVAVLVPLLLLGQPGQDSVPGKKKGIDEFSMVFEKIVKRKTPPSGGRRWRPRWPNASYEGSSLNSVWNLKVKPASRPTEQISHVPGERNKYERGANWFQLPTFLFSI